MAYKINIRNTDNVTWDNTLESKYHEILDTNGKFTGTDVESVLEEMVDNKIQQVIDTVDPTTGDSYPVGTIWVNSFTGVAYICVEDTLWNGISITGLENMLDVSGGTNVADTLIYNPSQDPDGGLWRDKCSDLSWYREELNTTTRGKTRKFPALSLIVADGDKVTIYDMTDPDIPMWMVFNGGLATLLSSYSVGGNPKKSVTMMYGVLVACSDIYGAPQVDFINDTGDIYRNTTRRVSNGNISQRNQTVSYITDLGDGVINPYVNDVAMTILQGNNYPTIAVATDGGVSVIDGPAGKGTVVDITWTDHGAVLKIAIIDQMIRTLLQGYWVKDYMMPSVDIIEGAAYVVGSEVAFYAISDQYIHDVMGDLPFLGLSSIDTRVVGNGIGTSEGLTLLKDNTMDPSNGMTNYITDEYQSGWQHGDIRLATLAGTAHGLGMNIEWKNTSNLSGATHILSLLGASDGSLYAGIYPYGEVLKSIDNGDTWTIVGDLPGVTWIYTLIESSDGSLYAGTSTNGDVFKSTDEGVTWTNTGDLMGVSHVYSLIESSDGSLYAGTYPGGKVFKSIDEGVTWINIGGIPGGIEDIDVLIESSDGSLYAGTYPNGDVYKSIDGGVTWINTGELSGVTQVYSLIESSDGSLYAGTYPNGDVFKSINGGVTWTNPGELSEATHVYSLIESSDGYLYAGTYPNGNVFRSIDGGVTWKDTGDLSGATQVHSLVESSDGYLYAGTYPNGNVFRSVEKVGVDITTDIITNGTFDTDTTGWITGQATATVVAGEVVIEITAGAAGWIYQAVNCSIGRTYSVMANVTAVSGTSPQLRVGTTPAGTDIALEVITGVGPRNVTFIATSLTHYITLYSGGSIGGSTTWDNASTKAIQSLVQNGEFSSNRYWVYSGDGAANGSIIGGQLICDGSVVGNLYVVQPIVGIVPGKKYKFIIDVASQSGGAIQVWCGYAPPESSKYTIFGTGIKEGVLVCSPSGGGIQIACLSGNISAINSFYCYELDVPDRSYRNNPLQVIGQLVKTPVATGSELVSYSGFSADNYIEQPYTEVIDFGAGDFCAMGWHKETNDSNPLYIVGQGSSDRSQDVNPWTDTIWALREHLNFYYLTTGSVGGTSSNIIGPIIIPVGLQFLCLNVISSVAYLYVNGILVGSGSFVPDGGIYFDKTFFGGTSSGDSNNALSLWRISASVPSAEQIEYIYNFEKRLFKDNTQCTLPDSNVIDIKYDEYTEKLAVLTDTGLTVLKDGVVVDTKSITAGVATDIHKDRLVYGSATEVTVEVPPINLREELETTLPSAENLLNYVSSGVGQTSVQIPMGYKPVQVFDDGLMEDFITTYDGFYYYANITASTGDVLVTIQRG